jgi:hypothetical protein
VLIHFSLVLVLAFLTLQVLREKNLHKLLALSVAFAISLWYIAPGLITMVFPYDSLVSIYNFGVGEEDFFFAYAIESGALCLIIGAVLLISRHCTIRHRLHDAMATPPGNRTTVFILVLFCFAIVTRLLFETVDYVEANAASLYDEKSAGSPFVIFRQLLVAAVVLLAVGNDSKGKTFYIAFLLICADSVLAIISGSRIALITPVVILAFKFLDRRLASKETFVLIFVALAFAVLVAVPIASLVADVRGLGLAPETYQFSEALSLDEGFRFGMDDVASMIFVKFDSFSTGALLINVAEGPGRGGITPYVGSALVFIPRAIWPNRPVAGSSEGTIYGHPTRIVASTITSDSDSFNVGVSPLHIAIWQLGYLGPICFVIASTGYILFLNSLLKAEFLSSILGVFLLSIPSFHMLITSPDVMVMQFVLALPFLLAIKLSRAVFVKGYAR